MTPTTLAETILRDVPTSIDGTGVWLDYGAVIEALTAALDISHDNETSATVERAGEVVTRLNARTVKRLPDNWKEGRKCPDCGSDATRPKCLWDHGPSCARHDPDAYDPPAWEKVPDRDCKEAADLITALLAQNAALRAERDELAAEVKQADTMLVAEANASLERLARAEAAEAQIAAITARVERLTGAVWLKVGECLAGMTHREVSQEARNRIGRALAAAITTEEDHA